ncbi:hypothetical protein AB0H77_30870 [Streptomyces sp. NPDC050844]
MTALQAAPQVVRCRPGLRVLPALVFAPCAVDASYVEPGEFGARASGGFA